MPEGPQLSSLPKRKESTILPRTPSPPLNKLPSSQPIIPTSIPPSQGTLRLLSRRHQPHLTSSLPPYPPPTSHPTTYLPPSLPPISPLTTLHQIFPPSFTIPSPLTRSHPHIRDVVILLLITSPTPSSFQSGNLSHWNAIQVRPIKTNTSRSRSPMSPCTLLTMSFSARPSLPPLKSPPSNGLPPFRYTPSTTLTPSPTCSPLTLSAAAHIKLQPSPFLASDMIKTRHSGLSSRLPFAHHTLIRK